MTSVIVFLQTWVATRKTDDDAGVTMIEYALLAALIAVVSVTIIGTVGTKILAKFTTIAGNL